MIGVFDSGSGGLSVLRELRKLVPGKKYVYFSDNANCPYGDRGAEFIIQRCREITELLLNKGAEIIVVACNTATAAAISSLRSEYDIPFIGMEPAVKPAALGTGTGVIGVLATAGTLKGSLYIHTKGAYDDKVKIIETVGRGFVELVESLELDSPKAREIVSRSLLPLLNQGADTIVLGCTHYPFLLPLMEDIALSNGYGDIRFINPAPALARRLLGVMLDKGIPLEDKNPEVELLASGKDDVMKRLNEALSTQVC